MDGTGGGWGIGDFAIDQARCFLRLTPSRVTESPERHYTRVNAVEGGFRMEASTSMFEEALSALSDPGFLQERHEVVFQSNIWLDSTDDLPHIHFCLCIGTTSSILRTFSFHLDACLFFSLLERPKGQKV